MRDKSRIELMLNVIKEYWENNPDLRFGQLVNNVVKDVDKLFYIEDDQFMILLLNNTANNNYSFQLFDLGYELRKVGYTRFVKETFFVLDTPKYKKLIKEDKWKDYLINMIPKKQKQEFEPVDLTMIKRLNKKMSIS